GFELVEEVIPGLNPSLSLTDATTSGGAISSCANNTSTSPPSSPTNNIFEQAEMVTMSHHPSTPKNVATLPGLAMANGLCKGNCDPGGNRAEHWEMERSGMRY